MENAEVKNPEGFRDHLATLTDEGKRKWVYPKKPKGKFHNARLIVAYLLLAILFGVPFIKINGYPFMLFDILGRKFIIFGITFGPQDFHLIVLTIISLVVFVFLFTVVFGRLWCGWTCPQTIFMEMLFRKIEYFIEGDANQQRALNNSPWNGTKILKKTIKHIIFGILSFLIANALLAWIIGIDSVYELASKPIPSVIGKFTAMVIFSGVIYFFYAYFREQVCTLICPYGRLQGVMLDQNSIVIAYDYKRGEPRGKIRKDQQQKTGDCIDCHLCVDVCPTGIDIRDGTQLECVNCTACIDACDAVMAKIKRPKGLIRFASKEEIETGIRKIITPRSVGYSIVLVLLIALVTFMLTTRSDFELSIVRTAGLLSQDQPGNKISNLYDFDIANKTFKTLPAKLELVDMKGEIKIVNGNLNIAPNSIAKGKFLVILPAEEVKSISTSIKIAVKNNDKVIDIIKTNFLGRIKRKGKK